MSGRRCMRAEKHAFLSLVEKGTGGIRERTQAFGLLSENLVIGDLASAETVVMAAYDTPRAAGDGLCLLSCVPWADGRPVAGTNRFFRRACRDRCAALRRRMGRGDAALTVLF